MRRSIQRQRYLVDYALGSMMRRKVRSAILLFVYALIVFMFASVSFLGSSLRQEAKLLLSRGPDMTIQSLRMGRHDMIGASHLAALEEIRGVRKAVGRLWGYHFDPATGANYTLMAPTGQFSEEPLQVGEVILGEGVARVRNIKKGDWFFVIPAKGTILRAKVKDLLVSESGLVTSDLVLLPESEFRRFFDLPDNVYTDIALTIRNRNEYGKIVEKGMRVIPHGRFIARDDILRTYESLFSWRQSLFMTVMTTSLFAFAILVFDKASGLSAEEKREIGILKAVGWGTKDVMAAKLWEGAVLSCAAFLSGVLLAYFHIFYGAAIMFQPVMQGWAVIYPDFPLRPVLDGFEFSILGIITIVPYIAATIVPIWKVAITDPEEVMR